MKRRQHAGGPRPVALVAIVALVGIIAVLTAAASVSAATPAQRADALLARMTLSQEISLVGSGVDGVPSLGIPPLLFTDGPNGVGEGAKHVTSFPNAVNIGASFDPRLARLYGQALGAEVAGSGKDLIGAPTINIVRSPLWGRAAETFGEDPFLTSQLVAPEIQGIQSQRVIAQVKHYAAYNQEVGRFGPTLGSPGVDVGVSERALQEIYFQGFHAAVSTGGAASVMCSYNRINGTQSCENPTTLGQLRAFGLRGFVEPDATLAVHDVLAAARAGVNNFQLGSLASAAAGAAGGQGKAETQILSGAVANGTLPRRYIDDSARNILIAMDRVGLLHHAVQRRRTSPSTPADRALATAMSTQATVLLKNRAGTLPLSGRTRTIAIIGADAGPTTQFEENGSPAVRPGQPIITPLAGIRSRAPRGTRVSFVAGTRGVVALPVLPARVLSPSSGSGGRGLSGTYYAGVDFSGQPIQHATVATLNFASAIPVPLQPIPGTTASSARWTGTLTPPTSGRYQFSIAAAGIATLVVDGRRLISTNTEFIGGGAQFPGAPPIVALGSLELRAHHRVTITVTYSTGLSIMGAALHLGWEPPDPTPIREAVAAAKRAQVAVVFANDRTSEGSDRASLALPGDQDRLIEAVAKANPHTVVVLHTAGPVLLPWRHQVAAIVEAWYPGQMSGRAIAETLYGDVDPSGRLPVTWPASARQGPTASPPTFPGLNNTVRYAEGIFVGYRYYDRMHQTPLYPFGYGLSYTTFALSHLHVHAGPGGGARVSVEVRNTGRRRGAEVVQLYLAFPSSAGEPPRQLKAFAKLVLGPKQERTVTLTLARSSFTYYSAARRRWLAAPGRYRAFVGTSSRDLPLSAPLRLG
jgi:beta-glucosidase